MVREVSIASILLTILGFCFQASVHHEIRGQVGISLLILVEPIFENHPTKTHAQMTYLDQSICTL